MNAAIGMSLWLSASKQAKRGSWSHFDRVFVLVGRGIDSVTLK